MVNHPNRVTQISREQVVHHIPTKRVGIVNWVYPNPSGYEYAVAFGNRAAKQAEIQVIPFFELRAGTNQEVLDWRTSQGYSNGVAV
jgi:hypothetical protein